MATILIGVDIRPKNATLMVLLGEALQAVGMQVEYANRKTLSERIRLIHPDVTVISGVGALGSLESLRRHRSWTRFVVVPPEGLFWDNKPTRMKFQSRDHCACIERFFFWGKTVADQLVDLGYVKPDQCVVTGALHMDLLDHYLAKREKSFPPAGRPKRFGLISRFPNLNVFDRRSVPRIVFEEWSMYGLQMEADGKVEDYFWYSVKTLRRFYEIVEYLMKKEGTAVSWRPHPDEDPKGYEFLKERYGGRFDVNYGTLDLAEWLADLDCVLMTFSTSFVEASAMGIPVISVNNLLDHPEIDFARSELAREIIPQYRLGFEMRQFFHHPGTLQELQGLLDQACAGGLRIRNFDEKQWRGLMRDYYDYPRDEPAFVTMVHQILDLVRCLTPGQSRPSGDLMHGSGSSTESVEPWFRTYQLTDEDIPFHRRKVPPVIEPYADRLMSLTRS